MSVCKYDQNLIKNFADEDIEITVCKQYGGDLPVVNTLAELIKELNKAFSGDYVNIELVGYLMKTYKGNPSDWKKFAKFDRYR